MSDISLNDDTISKMTSSINQLNDALSKIAKFSNIKFDFQFDSINGVVNSVQSLDSVLTGVSKSFSSLGSFNENINKLAEGGSVLANAYNVVNGALLGNVEGLNLQTIATNIATASSIAFSAVLEFLKANPLVAIVGAIGLVVGALALFGDSETEAEKETRLFTEAQEAKRNELIETAKTINESTASAINNAKNAEIQSDVLKSFVGNLRGLADENGYVKNFEEAQYYVDKINSAMPGTVKLTEDGKLAWLKNADAIDENIKQLERKAKVEAYYDGYVESLKNETKLRSELTLAQSIYNTELAKQQEYQNRVNELMELSREGILTPEQTKQLTDYNNLLQESNGKLEGYSTNLEKAKGAYEANAKGAELYQQAVGALDESVTASALLQAEEYTSLEENGTSTWGSIAAASEDCKNRVLTAQEEELETVQATSQLIKDEMVNKALEQGMTYNQMIDELEKSGVKMNETEKSQLQDRYNLWDMNSKDIKNAEAKGLETLKLMKMTTLSKMNEDEKIKLADNVKLFAASGDESGLELCNKLAKSLEENNGEVKENTQSILDEIADKASKNRAETKVKANGPSKEELDKINQSAKNGLKDQKLGVDIEPNKKGFSIFGYKINFDWWPFAEGGFPPTGDLFVAREAGPELVGRINGKTAVANNDQIVSGISSGVYNAVRSAMAGNGGNGNMNIHATFVMDGEIVGKQVIKYHNGVVKRTGATPLMI